MYIIYLFLKIYVYYYYYYIFLIRRNLGLGPNLWHGWNQPLLIPYYYYSHLLWEYIYKSFVGQQLREKKTKQRKKKT